MLIIKIFSSNFSFFKNTNYFNTEVFNTMILKDAFMLSFIASGIIGVAISYKKIYLFHILGTLVFTYFILKVFKNNFIIKYPKLPTRLHYIFYFFFFWYLFSIIWSLHQFYSIIYMVYVTSGIFFSLTIVYYVNFDEIKLKKVFKISAYVFSVLIFISLLEIFTSFRLPHSPYPSTYDIASGFFGNQNNLATTMTMILPFFLFSYNLSIKYIGTILIVLIVFVSFSRTNILAIIFIIFTYLFAYKKNIKHSTLIKTMSILFIIFILLFIYTSLNEVKIIEFKTITSSYNALLRYINIVYIEEYDSVGIRKQLIINGLEALKKSYGLGVGGGASKYVQEQFSSTKGITSMHNFWIELLVEGGLVFFIIFLIWYQSLVRRLYLLSWKSKNETLKYFASAISLSMMGFVLGAVSVSSAIYLLPMWLLYGFAISVINVYERNLLL